MTKSIPKMLTLMSDSPETVETMLSDGKVVLKCWICGKKQDEKFWGLISEEKGKELLLSTTVAREFKTKIATFSLVTKNHGTIKVSVCLTCRFLIPEIVRSHQLQKEKKDSQKEYSEENNKDQLFFM